jgi:hypothetical protein
MENLLIALHVSDPWYTGWLIRGKLHYKARSVVLFDRLLNENTKKGAQV